MQSRIEDLFILLVEPSSTQRQIIQGQFEQLGIKNAIVKTTGAEALEWLKDNKPDLVIAAMHLPDMTSIDLVYKLREDEENQEIYFMLISTVTTFEQIDPIKQAGATAVLPKPFSVQQLKQALYTNLDFLEPERLELQNFDVESMNVLVVDDSRFARRQIIRTLGKMGMENFSEAVDGMDAIPKIENEYFDLIVTDYNMPQMDGKHLVDYIRNESNQQTVPVLMVTTEGDLSKLSAVEQSGVSAICDKPFEPKTVKAMIEAVMAS